MSSPPRKAGPVGDVRLWIDKHIGVAALGEISSLVLGATFISVVWFFGVAQLRRIDALQDSMVVTILQLVGPAVMVFGTVFGTVEELRKAAQARKATTNVADALDDFQRRFPGVNIADIPADELAAKLETGKVNREQIVRLVEQRKQQLLIDDEYFRRELSYLIVDYLQPLPRNAKRVLNRFRVNLLIAHGRGMFTSHPRVTTQQIGKWLVLGERWPQLARSLSAAPDAIESLEQHAARPAPAPVVAAAMAAVAGGTPPAWDPFMDEIGRLAHFYLGDEDLRKFIQSKPSLTGVLARLVHYGTP